VDVAILQTKAKKSVQVLEKRAKRETEVHGLVDNEHNYVPSKHAPPTEFIGQSKELVALRTPAIWKVIPDNPAPDAKAAEADIIDDSLP
jgi:hypothetical protein